MNLIEKKMSDILSKLKNEFGVDAVKAEFEAEGTRMDELLRLIEIVRKNDLKLGIKIGGCEAIKDLMECKQIGCDYIIAPMVETEYALSKFIQAKNKVYDDHEKSNIEFLINIETITTFNNLKKIENDIKLQKNKKENIQGLVFGRVDFSLSNKYSREDINENKVTKYILDVAKVCKDNELSFVVGGGVSSESILVLKEISKICLNRFETRKIIFSKESLSVSNLDKGMLEAIHFELLWLKNKKEYYGSLYKEDDKRIDMLSKRWGVNKT